MSTRVLDYIFFASWLIYASFLKLKPELVFPWRLRCPYFPRPPPTPRCFKRKHQRGRRSRWMRGGVGGKDARRGGEAHGGAQGCSVGRETLCFPAILLRLSFPIQVRAPPPLPADTGGGVKPLRPPRGSTGRDGGDEEGRGRWEAEGEGGRRRGKGVFKPGFPGAVPASPGAAWGGAGRAGGAAAPAAERGLGRAASAKGGAEAIGPGRVRSCGLL